MGQLRWSSYASFKKMLDGNLRKNCIVGKFEQLCFVLQNVVNVESNLCNVSVINRPGVAGAVL